MAEFVSTFITGFSDVVKTDLEKNFSGIKILNLYDGLVHYKYDGDSRQLEKINYFNNTFFLLKSMKGRGLNFPSLVGAVTSSKNYFLVNKGSFRIRFIQENQFAKVDKNLTRRAEEYVLRNSKLSLDRLSPSNEVWFCIRREAFAFCGELIFKREFTEKNLNKGELRPEIAYLICAFAGIKENSCLADPFAGYASIPLCLKKHYSCKSIFASDLEPQKTEIIKKRMGTGENIRVSTDNALELKSLEDKSLDAIITDPPWGIWEKIDNIELFYQKMFSSFKRVLKEEGSMTILTAKGQELEAAAKKEGAQLQKSLHTLVNGKKASLYNFTF